MRPRHVIAATLVVTACPFATWFLIGDLTENVADPDYMFHPSALTGTQSVAIGVTAIALATIGIAVVLSAARRGVVDVTDLAAAGPLLATGAFVGASERAMTAGVIGANIGGGLLILGSPVVLLGLVGWSGLLWCRRRAL